MLSLAEELSDNEELKETNWERLRDPLSERLSLLDADWLLLLNELLLLDEDSVLKSALL